MNYTYEQLGQEQARISSALSAASDAQRRARSNDTLGVIFLGLPVSSLSGSNVASEIARLKGELQAVQKAMTLKQNMAPPMAKFSTEDRLKELESLRKEGLVTQETFEKRRDEILKGI